MIYLHKILPILISPLFIVLVMMLIGGYKKSSTICYVSVAVLLVFSMPIASNTFSQYAENDYPARQRVSDTPTADAIVVLSGMLTRSPSVDGEAAEWTDPDRFFGGVELFKAHKSDQIIFTRGKSPWYSHTQLEGEVPREVAIAMGVPDTAIKLTGTVENTEDEALAVKQVFDSPTPKIILITSAYHMSRAKRLFESQGFEVFPFPVDFKTTPVKAFTPMDFLPNANSLARSDGVIRELIGRAYYRICAVTLSFR